jgi:hypothetical protein
MLIPSCHHSRLSSEWFQFFLGVVLPSLLPEVGPVVLEEEDFYIDVFNYDHRNLL